MNSVTKAEDKVKNITEAIEVFQQWLTENGGADNADNHHSQGAKNADEHPEQDNAEKSETVPPGLGYKSKEAALSTIK